MSFMEILFDNYLIPEKFQTFPRDQEICLLSRSVPVISGELEYIYSYKSNLLINFAAVLTPVSLDQMK